MAKKILLVDDSASVRGLFKLYLSKDFEVVEAEDGVRAWQLVKLMKLDFIIADINMPKCDGISFLKKVRSSIVDRIATTKVALLTGDSGEALERESLAAGADYFVRKHDARTLLPVIVEALREPK